MPFNKEVEWRSGPFSAADGKVYVVVIVFDSIESYQYSVRPDTLMTGILRTYRERSSLHPVSNKY